MKLINALSALENKRITTDSKIILFLQFFISASFAIVLLYPNFSAQWGIIDDHQIMAFMGNDLKLTFREIPARLMETEVGHPGTALRYRPAYYSAQLVETALWGNNPSIWYSFRVFLFGISFFIAWRLLGRVFGTIIGVLSCLILISHSFWADIWTRLGPGETYCVAGVAFYILAFTKLWGNKRSRIDTLWWFILAFAAIIAMGSKENFLILLPVSAILVYHARTQNRLSKLSILINLVLFSFGLFVAAAIIIALKKNGADIYANSVEPIKRFQLFISGISPLWQWKIQLPLLLSLIFLRIAAIFKKQYPDGNIASIAHREFKQLFWIETGLLLLWYSQFFFYNGAWPKGTRYDFPGVLASDLAYIFVAYSPLRILQLIITYSKFNSAPQVLHVLFVGILVLLIVTSGIKEFKLIHKASLKNRNTTQAFTQSFLRIVGEVKKSPNSLIIFDSHNCWDKEPIFSLRSFLSAYGVKNPLVLNGWSEKPQGKGIEFQLASALHQLSENGDLGASQIPFYPVQIIQQANSCFVLSFSGSSNLSCKNLGRI
jgi:hypothetical protein